MFSNRLNSEDCILTLLKKKAIVVDTTTILSELEKHPDYPSLVSISDVLRATGIINKAYRVPADSIHEVPVPFIAHTVLNNGDFVVVENITANHLTVSNHRWHAKVLPLSEFKSVYNGTVLTIEQERSTPAEFMWHSLRTTARKPAIIAGFGIVLVVAVILTGYVSYMTWQSGLLLLFKTIGLSTALLLLVQSIDENNSLVQRLCESGSKANCNAILGSDAAKVFSWLTWSEVGFFYFSGTWLLLLFGGHTASTIVLLGILNLLCIPYTFYSIYYQARVAKQWCIFCCIIQAVLWLEFGSYILLLKTASFPTPIDWKGTLLNATLWLLLPIIVWSQIKPLLLKAQSLNVKSFQLRTLKYNHQTFDIRLKDQPKYTVPDDEWSIVIGNVEANTILTVVSNPYCGPCAAAHRQLMDVLAFRSDFQARIVFTATTGHNDKKTPIVRHLLALNKHHDRSIVADAMHAWYAQKEKNYEAWAKRFPTHIDEVDTTILEKQMQWVELAEVTATPTILVNGYVLPRLYQLADLKYMPA